MLSGEPVTQRPLVEATNLDEPGGPRVTYTPHPGTTPESELAALAAVSTRSSWNVVAAPANEKGKEVDSEERRQGQDQ